MASIFQMLLLALIGLFKILKLYLTNMHAVLPPLPCFSPALAMYIKSITAFSLLLFFLPSVTVWIGRKIMFNKHLHSLNLRLRHLLAIFNLKVSTLLATTVLQSQYERASSSSKPRKRHYCPRIMTKPNRIMTKRVMHSASSTVSQIASNLQHTSSMPFIQSTKCFTKYPTIKS